jgi:biotin transport system substrate-specific component
MSARVLTFREVLPHQGLSWTRDVLLVMLGSALIALAGQLSIKLPFSPVPFVFASHVCLALGVVLGKRRGALAVLAYLAQGAMGLPVFAAGGSGLLYLLGPTGGYLVGWVFAAYLSGHLMENRLVKTPLKVFSALAAGNGLVFVLGALHLARFIGFEQALLLGVLPFFLTDALKLVLAERSIRACRL